MAEIKTGRELCDTFFEDLQTDDQVDKDIASLLQELYRQGKLIKESIMLGLESLRKQGRHE